MMNAAYIHIPFCEHICHYCDFNKVFLKGQPVDEYLEYLDKEIELTLRNTESQKFNTIFIGGGTPTALNEKQLDKLLKTINNYLPAAKDYEYTFEANPGDLSYEKLSLLHDAGVNRLSLGVQTFNDELLKRIGRVHRAKDVFQSVDAAKKAGFENISIDLIYSLPGQTIDDFKETLSTSFTLDIQHYSGYSLIIEPKTVFYNLMRKGKLPTPGEDVEAAMYELLMEEMDKRGYQQYEISNFAKQGYESKHNLTYWNNEWYYGFGAGAHGYVNGYRTSNHGPLKKYMEPIKSGDLPILDKHKTTIKEQMEEEMFLGLRKINGVSISHFKEKFNDDPLRLFGDEIQAHMNNHLLKVDGDEIKLTRKGCLLGNEVFQSFIK
ncbi:oxygen-independent coproporphyrinogen III oxidase [Cytobacillus horneckiae]|uniref:Heme chaperone HemW n=1 Tax=Cytobacillus horneckiae TaxID=549687 RepID=A0A2N0ZID7_9BACI|nr:radical SAM family heme chaperone HemW [Cytobacillus horneckiae]MBN6888932.1 oxygen-independent coproporphyrinogen III oxidase [Cytobacillus horneckiae]MCM3179887.1 radical SAM family heme chaperone HemW [Cytobacillus horneckiae]MEC1155276.1 radical SAM family heme chaperone HemW [Cytobacillus horneckiae]MED2936671.1 radical SAM family heme chaperone HemW [Cytobacillus horneckiae]PKG29256.1 coproporphyrinogen III oxidase [Cytobacillus horneckiae]